jgi:hypothetical protein
MILTAHQPAYLPWLGLFHKISISDIYVFMDDVRYSKSDFSNRNKIYDKNKHKEDWLTIPLYNGGKSGALFNNIILDKNDKWRKNHLGKIVSNYSKTPYFKEYFIEIRDIINGQYEYFSDLTYDLLLYFIYALGIEVKIYKASSLCISSTGNQYLIDICTKLKADKYVFGEQGIKYADIEVFNESGINVVFQKYNHPVYNQSGECFLPYMSIIDLLFNHGQDSYDILMSGNTTDIYIK